LTARTEAGTSPVVGDPPLVDPEDVLRVMEYYAEKGWTDGLPVVPVTESYLQRFLAQTDRDPADVVLAMPHLNRALTVRLAAINAAMAGCKPEYFPVVLAAWDSFVEDGYVTRAIWQSTTGTAPFLVVNGPIRDRIGLNSQGNVFGSGFRANATIGRAIRLTSINAFGLRPRQLDQATQGTPIKYSACIAENEEESPWPAFHTDYGLGADESAVTCAVVRGFMHIENRHSTDPEQLARDFIGSICRTGVLVHATTSAVLVLGPEHANVFARAGWSKADLQQFLYENSRLRPEDFVAVGKDGFSRQTRWHLPRDHPDALSEAEMKAEGIALDGDNLRLLNGPGAVLVVVAGANNAGVSGIIESFGPRGGPPAVTKIPDPPT
jgi:hypothetical protein